MTGYLYCNVVFEAKVKQFCNPLFPTVGGLSSGELFLFLLVLTVAK